MIVGLFERHDWITTQSGQPFFPLDPTPEHVRLADIAHGLSMLCRFAGQTRQFYSVAQHSVIVSQCCGEEHALWGLLHDASEAYLCDLPRPVKHHPAMQGYRELEARVQAAICDRFELPREEPPIVKAADILVLGTEKRDLIAMPEGWASKAAGPFTIVPWTPRQAEQRFLRRFHELRGHRCA